MTNNRLLNAYQKELEDLREDGMLRAIPNIQGQGKWLEINGERLLNLSSNDYLGIFEEQKLIAEFLHLNSNNREIFNFSSGSSRLLTGNYNSIIELETLLAKLYNKEAALVFNSGYHANIGILPALCKKDTLIIADKLVHASIIDGIKLSGGEYQRYRHNDINHLESILKKSHHKYSLIIVVTEGIFSMEGDKAHLKEIVQLKSRFPNIMLYVDEAHSFGVCGEGGLGVSEEENVIDDIDILVGTFGKAVCSVGAFAVVPNIIKEYLINRMRSLIFTTALPPINIEWSRFIINKFDYFRKKREHLSTLSKFFNEKISNLDCNKTTIATPSQIAHFNTRDALRAVKLSNQLKECGFYALPVRPPTVPPNKSGLRFSLTAAMNITELDNLYNSLNSSTKL